LFKRSRSHASDGKIDQLIDLRDVKSFRELHQDD
jgi:arginine decarboxylase-like protein